VEATAQNRTRNSALDRLILDLLGDIERLPSKRAFLARADETETGVREQLTLASFDSTFARLLARRLVNLAVARYHFHHRHTTLASGPVQLIIDPVNNCHLSCPGCVHSSNPGMDGIYDWPGGRISEELYRAFLSRYGPRAWGVVFYNWGEPLLDKRTPRFVREAKRLLLHTSLSTNLSVPLDAAALVGSGLNFLFASIDGVTQEVYSKFRRGGKLELCLRNLEAILEERQRQNSGTPFVIWRFLTFDHNAHQASAALELARALGVDEFSVFTPFAVPWDDPALRPVESEIKGTYLLNQGARFKGPLDFPATADLDSELVEAETRHLWTDFVDELAPEEESRSRSSTCGWLYQSLTMDAGGRTLPCCMAPEHGSHKVYGSFGQGKRTDLNQTDFRLSRLAFADRDRFDAELRDSGLDAPPYCAICTDKPVLTYDLERDLSRDLRLLDPQGLVSDETIRLLSCWPRPR